MCCHWSFEVSGKLTLSIGQNLEPYSRMTTSMSKYVFASQDGYIVIAGRQVYVGNDDNVDVFPIKKWFRAGLNRYFVTCEAGKLTFPKPGRQHPSTLSTAQNTLQKLRKIRSGSAEERRIFCLLTEKPGVEPPGASWQP